MGPKVLAACEFVEKTGKHAVIGSMTDTPALLRQEAGQPSRSTRTGSSSVEPDAPE